MEIAVLEQDKNRMKFVLKGAGHTFCNNLKRELYADKNVHVASYRVDHPLIGTPTFILEKTGTASFAKILADAAKRIQKQNAEAQKAFKKLK